MTFRINLLPREQKKSLNVIPLVMVLAVALLIMGLVFYYIYGNSQIRMLETQKEGLERELTSLAPVVQKVEDFQRTKSQVEERLFYEEIFYPRFSWVEMVKEISLQVPENVRLLQLRINQDGDITLEGETIKHQEVSIFMKALQDTPYFFDVNLGQSVSTWRDAVQSTRFQLTFKTEKGELIHAE